MGLDQRIQRGARTGVVGSARLCLGESEHERRLGRVDSLEDRTIQLDGIRMVAEPQALFRQRAPIVDGVGQFQALFDVAAARAGSNVCSMLRATLRLRGSLRRSGSTAIST